MTTVNQIRLGIAAGLIASYMFLTFAPWQAEATPEQVTICHFDRNNSGPNAGPHLITVNANAVSAHLENHTAAKGYTGNDSTELSACQTSTSTATSTATPTTVASTTSTPTSTPTPEDTATSQSTETSTSTATSTPSTPVETSIPTVTLSVIKTLETTADSPPVTLPNTGHGHEEAPPEEDDDGDDVTIAFLLIYFGLANIVLLYIFLR